MRVTQLFAVVAAAAVSANAYCVPNVRREWRTLTHTQKKAFLDAVKCLGNTPHDPSLNPTGNGANIPPVSSSSSAYDDLVYIHMDLASKLHATGNFFPWHRMYLHIFETALKEKCSFTGTLPYWDWTQDVGNFQNSPIFDSDSEAGFGTWGVAANDFQIQDGALAGSDFIVSYPVPHNIRRNYTAQPYLDFPLQYLLDDPTIQATSTFTQPMVDAAVNSHTGDFKGFAKAFSDYQGPHAGVHLIVGADLTGTCPQAAGSGCVGGETWSPNDPLFFLHHGRIDKAWFDWQWNDPSNYFDFEGGATQALDTLSNYLQYPVGAPPSLNFASQLDSDGLSSHQYKILDVMSTLSPFLCYVYA